MLWMLQRSELWRLQRHKKQKKNKVENCNGTLKLSATMCSVFLFVSSNVQIKKQQSQIALMIILNPKRGADPGIFYWGVQTLVPKGLLNFFVASYFSRRRLRVAQSVIASCRWRGKYCFACRGEQIIGGYPKTITFFNIPGIQCNARFVKKISQLKNAIRSYRCKNFSLKQAPGRFCPFYEYRYTTNICFRICKVLTTQGVNYFKLSR